MSDARANVVILLSLLSIAEAFIWSSLNIFGSSPNCTATEKRCNADECLDLSRWCDGIEHCNNGEDEDKASCQELAARECLDPSQWFRCNNQRCVTRELVCNTQNDCEDWSDEANCTAKDLNSLKNCSSTEWSCDDGITCVPRDWQCDGNADCFDETDEQNCTCSPDLYQCPNSHLLECIDPLYRCDGKRDCRNGADETDPECDVLSQCTTHEGYILCKDGRQCIHEGQTCDGYDNCQDKSDERNCSICKELSCDQGCIHRGGSARCACRTGFTLDSNNITCTDINECWMQSSRTPPCSQECINDVGSFRCICIEGYLLEKDKRRCKAEGHEATLILASSNQIRTFALRTELYDVLQEGYREVVDIAVDSHDRMIYWSDGHTKQVHAVDIHGYNYLDVVKHGLESPRGVSYDWLNKLLYVVDGGKKAIYACRADGAYCTVVIDNLGDPNDIVVDPISRYIYFTDLASPATIKRSDSDGSNVAPLVISLGSSTPHDLLVDYTTGCLYWIDSQLHLKRIDYYCFYRKPEKGILKAYDVHNPSSLAIFEDEIYWSNNGRVVRANKFNGLGMEEVIREMTGVASLDIMHPSLQPRPHDRSPSCRGDCSHICLPSNHDSFVCACPTELALDRDGLRCVPRASTSYLLIGRQTKILKLSVGHIGNAAFTDVDVNYINSMYLIDYDPVNESIVFVDKDSRQRPVVCAAQLTDESQIRKTVIVGEGISSVEGLAVDWVGRNVLWIDYIKRTIEVARLDGSARAVITDQSLMEPHSLALYPDDGLLFYADWGDSPHIQSCNMDATNCFLVVHDGVRQPNCLTVDRDSDRLFWNDIKLNEVFSVSIDGTDRSSPIFASHVKSLAVEGSLLYWTDGSDLVHVIDRTSRNAEERTYHSGQRGLMSMTLVNARKSKPVDNGCSDDNGGCSHICLATAEGAVCICPANLTLSEDGFTCYNKHCKTDEIVCARLGHCLSNKTRCDGIEDCPDRSDEKGCPGTCTSDEFMCNDGRCISGLWRCDADDDCDDGEDEEDCPEIQCDYSEFRCDVRRCVPNISICDKHDDCKDGSDEVDCPACDPDQFQCSNDSCIDMTWSCDGDEDCTDGSDEKNCTWTCTYGQFQCTSGQCVEKETVCDGVSNCQDGSDESENCTACPKESYRCLSMTSTIDCHPEHVLCDGKRDCQLGDDEDGCPAVCADDEFTCKSKDLCIADSHVCDQVPHCPDESDEDPEICNTGDCPGDTFQCLSGECIQRELRCNLEPDCPDGSDETELCGRSCEYANLDCSHNCTLTNTGVKCVCYDGYDLAEDERSCLDRDECRHLNGVCGQTCYNTKGGYSCQCAEGYELALDKHTCKATGERPYLLVADEHGITKISVHTKSSEVLVNTKTPPIFLDTLIQPDRRLFVWTTQETQDDHNVSLIKMYTAVTPRTVVMTTGKITGLAVDWLALNLYYTQTLRGNGFIRACSFKHKDTCHALLKKKNWSPKYIVLHPVKGLMFWMQMSERGLIISKSWMDGSHEVQIVSTPTDGHVGLTLDPITDRLYWADVGSDCIRTATTQGEENVVILRRKFDEPFMLDFFENSLFLSEQMSVVQFARFKEHKHKQPITIQKLFQPMGIKVVHPLRQTLLSGHINPCLVLNCTQICLLQAKGEAKCVCRDGMIERGSGQCGAVARTVIFKKTLKKVKCLNGGTIVKNMTHGTHCSCPPEFTGFECEVAVTTLPGIKKQENGDNKAWVAAVVITILLLACIAAAVYFVRAKRKSMDLVSIIKFRNPAFKSPKDEDAEELVTEIAFGNPGFQDFDEIPEQDWLTKLVASTSQMSVDSAFASRQGSFVNPDGGSDSLEKS